MIIFSSIRTVNNKEISTSLKFDETLEKGLLTISSDSENHEISVKRALIKMIKSEIKLLQHLEMIKVMDIPIILSIAQLSAL